MLSIAAALLLAPAPLLAGPPAQRGGRAPSPAPAQAAGGGGGADDGPEVPAIQDAGDFYVLQFTENVDEAMSLDEFVKACQEATGRNFTYDQPTDNLLQQGKVRMFGQKRVPKRDFYAFFQIMMFINDFACVEVGPSHLSVVVIQSITQSSQGARGIRQKAVFVDPSDLDDYIDQPATLITTTIHLPNTDVRQLSTSLRALLTDNNTQNISPAGQSDNLVLTGFGSNIAALAKLLLLVDEQSKIEEEPPPVFDVIPLEFATAEDVADLIDQLLEASNRAQQQVARGRPTEQGVSGALTGRGGGESKILVDARTNSLLVMALPDDLPRIKDLVARLDIEVTEPERNFHIFSLQNVNADDIAQVLEDFLDDASRLGSRSGGGRSNPSGQTPGTSTDDGEVVVVPDPGTNSLLIAANKSRYEEVLDIIRQLDRRQDQVLIETALVELTGSDTRDLGFEWGLADLATDADDVGGFGVTSFGLSELVDLDGDGVLDSRVPAVADGFTAGILEGDDFNLPFLLRVLETRDNANVLSVPSILVNNNGTATVSTVDEQPFTQITATGGVSGQTQENFQGYEEAGITLTISPSISASRYLRLGIELSVSSFAGAFSGSIPPPRTTRELRTSVNVPDGDTMVIGGIVSDNSLESISKVPLLGDIPLLGELFKRRNNSSSRTTLFFFVTPHILHDKDFADLAEISYRKKLKAAEVIGRDRVQVIDPNFGRSRDELGLEAFEVPLYRSPTRGEVSSQDVGLDPMKTQELLEGSGEDQ